MTKIGRAVIDIQYDIDVVKAHQSLESVSKDLLALESMMRQELLPKPIPQALVL